MPACPDIFFILLMYVRYSAIFSLELYVRCSEYILEKDVCSVMSVLVSAGRNKPFVFNEPTVA